MATAQEKRELIQRRTRALNEMNENLKYQSAEIERLTDNEQAETINSHYRVGQICKKIVEDPETFGTEAMSLLCDVHGTSRRVLQRNMRFVDFFPEEDDLERLLDMADEATNFRLTWAHIDYLLTIDTSAELRWQFAAKAVNDLLTPKQLHDKIRKRLNREGSGHGRPHAIPRTLSGQLDQMLDMLNTLLQKSDQIWVGSPSSYSMWRAISELNPQGCTPELQLQLEQLNEKLAAVQQMLIMNGTQAERAISHVTQAVAQQAAARPAIEAGSSDDEEDSSSPAPVVRNRRRRVSME